MPKAIIVLALAAAAAVPAAPATSLAGRYAFSFPDPFTKEPLNNVMEIVPVDPTHAYVRITVKEPNGMNCGIWGIARAAGNGLFYRSVRRSEGSGEHCTLTIQRTGREIVFDDSDARTCSDRCGLNATLEGAFSWSSRRPISYEARLKRSREYREAMAEWKRQPADY